MKCVFYATNGLYAWLIKFVTKGKYTHCGIVIEDAVYEAHPFRGVIKSKYNPFDWQKSFDIKVSDKDSLKIKKFLESELGCGYDWFGVARFVFPFFKPNKNKWFCSELVGEVLKKINFIKKNTRISIFSPERVFQLLKKKFDKKLKKG